MGQASRLSSCGLALRKHLPTTKTETRQAGRLSHSFADLTSVFGFNGPGIQTVETGLSVLLTGQVARHTADTRIGGSFFSGETVNKGVEYGVRDTTAMKPKILLCLALVAFGLSSQARGVRLWSNDELMAASDLIVVGQLIKVRDLDEVNTVLWSGNNKLLGVEATFAVSKVLKGDFTNRTVVLHYYRWENHFKTSDAESAIGSDVNSPGLIYLTPTNTSQFLLYLVSDEASRYAPLPDNLIARGVRLNQARLRRSITPQMFFLLCTLA